MFRQVRFDCGACGEGFVDWHDQDWERSSVFCVHCGARIVAGASVPPSSLAKLPLPSGDARSARALGVLRSDGEGFRDTLPGLTEGDSSRDRDTEPPLPRAPLARNASQATSTAPKERITLEDKSRDTLENARFTRELVQPRPGERWLLVTSAHHMPRSVGLFRSEGFSVEAYPVDYRTRGAIDLLRFFSTVGDGLRRTDTATREWVGLLVYRLTGRTAELFPAP